MRAGLSLEALGDLPLDSWVALYKVVRAEEMQVLAAQVGAIHAADPRRLRDQLMAESHGLLDEHDQPVWEDPKRLATMMGMLGVTVGKEDKTGEGPEDNTKSEKERSTEG